MVEAVAKFPQRASPGVPISNLRLEVRTESGEALPTQPARLVTDSNGTVSFVISPVPFVQEILSLRISPRGLKEPQLRLDLPLLNAKSCLYGVLIQYPRRDKRGRKFLELWVKEALDPFLPLEEVFSSPSVKGVEGRSLDRFERSDIIIALNLKVVVIEPEEIDGFQSMLVRAEAEVRPQLWWKWGKRILWTGPGVKEIEWGNGNIEAARLASLRALRRAGNLIRRKLVDLFSPPKNCF